MPGVVREGESKQLELSCAPKFFLYPPSSDFEFFGILLKKNFQNNYFTSLPKLKVTITDVLAHSRDLGVMSGFSASYLKWKFYLQVSTLDVCVKPGFHIVVSGLLWSLLNLKFRQKLSTTIWKHERNFCKDQ